MNKKLLLITLCCGLLIVTGCGYKAKLSNGKEVAASIEGKEITAEDLYNELKKQYGISTLINTIDGFIANKEIKTDADAKNYVDAQIKSLRAQYEQNGQDFATVLINAGYANENELKDVIMLDYKKNKVVKNYLKTTITDKQIDTYYKDEIFGAITVRHILIKPETTADMSTDEKEKAEEKALNEAKDLIKQLDKGAKFEDLAKKHSDDEGTASEGGLFADFTKDSVVSEFWDASAKLKDGKYTSSPVKSAYGYHIILRVSQKNKPKLADVKDDIIDKLVSIKLKEENAADKAWVEIRKKYKLDIADTSLKSKYNTSIKTLDK